MTKKKLIIISITVVLVILAGMALVANQKYNALIKSTSEGLSFGKQYGKMVKQSNCMGGLPMKYASCSSTECELSATGFIVACMEAAEKDSFCSTVPPFNDTDKAMHWVSKGCSSYNLGSGKCLKYMHKFIDICTEQKSGVPISTAERFEGGFKKGVKRASEQEAAQ